MTTSSISGISKLGCVNEEAFRINDKVLSNCNGSRVRIIVPFVDNCGGGAA